MMMPVRFSVRGDVDDLGPTRADPLKAPSQPPGKVLTLDQQLFERDRLRDGAVIKEHPDTRPDGRLTR